MSVDVLTELKTLIAGLNPDELAELDALLEPELKQAWLPNPGPQTDAFLSKADLLLYGGAAGGGKSDLLLGLSQTEHTKSVIFRRAYTDIRGLADRLLEIIGTRDGWNGADKVLKRGKRMLEFGALEKPGSEFTWQGRDHDLIGFDEGAQLSAAKVRFVMGWLRSKDPKQRCRIVIASNPPMGGDGEWLIQWFAPWLDPLFSNPAAPGELRWAYQVGEETVWVDGPGVTVIDGEEYEHLSRTFIPALLDDNPFLKDSGYRGRLQNMPEPLRSQLLNGDFLAGREDHEWQVIPSEWVRLAQERWKKAQPKRRQMVALAGDVAIGGKDWTVLAPLYTDCWFGPLVKKPGVECQSPDQIAVMMLQARRDAADLSVDGTGGWGSGVRSHLKNDHQIDCYSIVFSAKSEARTADGKLGFLNLRAQMYWRFREALDPETGDEVMLPVDARLTAHLTASRYFVRGDRIVIEDKDDIKERVGASPDDADAVVMAWHRRKASLKRKSAPPPRSQERSGAQGWMGV
jgi:hypothetical protein